MVGSMMNFDLECLISCFSIKSLIFTIPERLISIKKIDYLRPCMSHLNAKSDEGNASSTDAPPKDDCMLTILQPGSFYPAHRSIEVNRILSSNAELKLKSIGIVSFPILSQFSGIEGIPT